MPILARRKIFDFHAQLQAQAYQAAQSTDYLSAVEIETCQRDFAQIANQSPEFISAERWLDVIAKNDICLFGDFHTSAHSQEAFKHLVQSLCRAHPGRRMVVCLEAFLHSDQQHLDSYVKGKISVKQLLRDVNYADSWGFHWDHYQSIVDFCMRHNIVIKGINAKRAQLSFAERDALMAQHIAQVQQDHQQELVVVLVGEYHLADSCLPSHIKRFSSAGDRDPRIVTVLNNIDHHFFHQLKRTRLAGGPQYLQVGTSTLGFMNTAPWVKWRSFTIWDDQQIAAKEQDSITNGRINLDDLFFDMVNAFADFMSLSNQRSHFQEFSLNLINQKLTTLGARVSGSKRNRDRLVKQLQREGFVTLEDRQLIAQSGKELHLLPRMVGEFLHLLHRPKQQPRAVAAEQFATHALQSAAGTLAALILNPHEPPTTPLSALQLGVKFDGAFFLKTWLEWLAQPKFRASIKHIPVGLQKMLADDTAASKLYSCYLGSHLGQLLNEALQQDKISIEDCRSLLFLSASRDAGAWHQLLNLYQLVKS